jgi:hypothetical protein
MTLTLDATAALRAFLVQCQVDENSQGALSEQRVPSRESRLMHDSPIEAKAELCVTWCTLCLLQELRRHPSEQQSQYVD